MMGALDHMDHVDLHIAQMLDRRRHRVRPRAERRARIKPLRGQPDAPGFGLGEDDRRIRAARHDASNGQAAGKIKPHPPG